MSAASASNMTHQARPRCFVVMPFGCKRFHEISPLGDGICANLVSTVVDTIAGLNGRSYDFDKVYRVFKKAAILANLEPFRADEQCGGIIHDDMLRALDESPVVLADLSMSNPNVYYEVGRRHGRRPDGTVLVCRAGTKLPFDISGYRVHFYEYDGICFDFDEVDRFVEELRPALVDAQRMGLHSRMSGLRESDACATLHPECVEPSRRDAASNSRRSADLLRNK